MLTTIAWYWKILLWQHVVEDTIYVDQRYEWSSSRLNLSYSNFSQFPFSFRLFIMVSQQRYCWLLINIINYFVLLTFSIKHWPFHAPILFSMTFGKEISNLQFSLSKSRRKWSTSIIENITKEIKIRTMTLELLEEEKLRLENEVIMSV